MGYLWLAAGNCSGT